MIPSKKINIRGFGKEMSGKVLITARAFWKFGGEGETLLGKNNFEVIRASKAGPYSAAELIPLLQGYTAIIGSTDEYSRELMLACPDLKVISRWGVGFDSIDLLAASELGVIASTTPGAMTDTVADYTFALLLGIARKITESDRTIRSGGWSEATGVLVCRKSLGLVGFGAIAQGVAKRATGFEMNVFATDPYVSESARKAFPQVSFVSLDSLLEMSDFVSVHSAATLETRGMFDSLRFAQMKSSAYFINTSRGSLVDEVALVEALETGKIAGAAIDVYAKEPPLPNAPIRFAPNTLLTTHNAFNTVEASHATSLQAAQNVIDLLNGVHLEAVRNPAVWESPKLRTSKQTGHSDERE